MNTNDDLHNDVLVLVAGLNAELGWGLSDEQVQGYALELTKILRSPSKKPTEQKTLDREGSAPERARWRALAIAYHEDHQQVEVLKNPQHPQHDAYWKEMEQFIMAILRHRFKDASKDRAIELDDLLQEALIELNSSIQNFAYASRLSTWIYSLVLRTAKRKIRDSRAIKRTFHRFDKHIDDLAADNQEPPSPLGEPEPEADLKALLAMMRDLVQQQQRAHMDAVLNLIIQGYSASEIGKLLDVHSSWVRRLLRDIRTLLKDDPEIAVIIRRYFDLDSPPKPRTKKRRSSDTADGDDASHEDADSE